MSGGRVSVSLVNADSLSIPLAAGSVHMIATSPPYWGLRDYGLGEWEGGDVDCDHIEAEIRTGMGLAKLGERYRGGGHRQGEIETKQYGRTCQKCGATRSNSGLGLELMPDCRAWARGGNCGTCYVCRVRLFAAECWRVLRDDGVMFLNLGDSYNEKQLVGIPWRVALALQADGWYLRSAPPWLKKNSMPESVKDRPSTGHEFVFLLTKNKKYYLDAEAIRKGQTGSSTQRAAYGWAGNTDDNSNGARSGSSFQRMRETGEPIATIPAAGLRNRRTTDFFFDNLDAYIQHLQHFRDEGGTLLDLQSGLPVAFNVSTKGYPGAHFACWPPELVEPMIKAGTSERGCCPECGAQWRRVVEKGAAVMRDDNPNPVLPYTADGHWPKNGNESSTLHMKRERKTAGWQPGCDHDLAPVPCIVLDPFAGSGTTGEKARELGRSFIGLDLSFDYLVNEATTRLELDRLDAWNGNGLTAGLDGLDALPLFNGAAP